MNTSSKWLTTLLLALCLLAGCNNTAQNAVSTGKANVESLGILEYPALPVIRNALFSMSPLVDGKRNPAVMQQICGLARDELKQSDVDRFVSASGETRESLINKGGVTALLVSGNHQGQEIACAAFLATAPLIQVDGNDFIAAQKGADGKLQVDSRRLKEVMAFRIALARTDAEYFSLIAEKLQQTPGLTSAQYQAKARELFSELAPAYLKRAKEQMPLPGTQYQLKRLDNERFAFGTSNGGEYVYGNDGMTLRQDNITWYGEGQLMGQRRTLKIAYYPDAVVERIR
ncbi:hypothetical protein [Pseudomonas sp. H9]|uniref:hypothetical protein n=1 Tax=Pseudomonas sp. H9 TaxID=483968 RepID=UPI0010581E0E|nr:hypothetical protein [Pseudomonas sp. H9]TDF86602.1 hypothetical protein E1573_00135 [Pseudomonas sp. H9]